MVDKILYIVKSKYENIEVKCVYKTGSSLFCENCKDDDYVVVCDNVKFLRSCTKVKGLNIDIFCIPLKGEQEAQLTYHSLAIALAFKNGFLYGEYPFDGYDYDKCKPQVLKQSYDFLSNRLLPLYRRKGFCDKRAVWLFAVYFSCINNSLDFTGEQKEILQKCHDNELSVNYAEELKVNIEKLLNE